MATLPSNSDMTGSGVTEGGFKTALNSVLTFLRDCLGSNGNVPDVRSALGLGAMATKATVASGDINDGAVTTAKVADGAITAAKLAANAAIPAGMVVDFAGGTAPSGWLLCYGQAVSRTTYSALFGAIGTTWGTGDGSTTFNLPDLRGRVRAGRDDMGGTAAGRLTNALTGNPGLDGTSLGAAGGVDRYPHGSGLDDAVHDRGGLHVGVRFAVARIADHRGVVEDRTQRCVRDRRSSRPCVRFQHVVVAWHLRGGQRVPVVATSVRSAPPSASRPLTCRC